MPLLINQQIVEDNWITLSPERLEESVELPQGDLIVPFTYFLENQAVLDAHEGQVGVQVNGDDNLAELYRLHQAFPLIAVEFPVLRDGRGFSIAMQLVRQKFQGQLRAVGDVAHDRLGYMERCGFNAFQIPEERFSQEDLAVFNEISVHYQGSAEDPRPLFRR